MSVKNMAGDNTKGIFIGNGSTFFCTEKENKISVYACGRNFYGQLGIGSCGIEMQREPVEIPDFVELYGVPIKMMFIHNTTIFITTKNGKTHIYVSGKYINIQNDYDYVFNQQRKYPYEYVCTPTKLLNVEQFGNIIDVISSSDCALFFIAGDIFKPNVYFCEIYQNINCVFKIKNVFDYSGPLSNIRCIYHKKITGKNVYIVNGDYVLKYRFKYDPFEFVFVSGYTTFDSCRNLDDFYIFENYKVLIYKTQPKQLEVYGNSYEKPYHFTQKLFGLTALGNDDKISVFSEGINIFIVITDNQGRSKIFVYGDNKAGSLGLMSFQGKNLEHTRINIFLQNFVELEDFEEKYGIIVDIITEEYHTFFVTNKHNELHLYCCGHNYRGELGLGSDFLQQHLDYLVEFKDFFKKYGNLYTGSKNKLFLKSARKIVF